MCVCVAILRTILEHDCHCFNVFAQPEGDVSPSPTVEFDTRLDKSYRQPRLPQKQKQIFLQKEGPMQCRLAASGNAAGSKSLKRNCTSGSKLESLPSMHLRAASVQHAAACHPTCNHKTDHPRFSFLLLADYTGPSNNPSSSLDTAPFLAGLPRVCSLQPKLDSSSRIYRSGRHACHGHM